MRRIAKLAIGALFGAALLIHPAAGQSFDEERMTRDIEVAENVLATLIKHEVSGQRTFFGLDVDGTYQPGYGVTFRLPGDHVMPFVISIGGRELHRAAVVADGNGYRYTVNGNDVPAPPSPDDDAIRLKERAEVAVDSARTAYHDHMISAAQNFILDYGDMLSQLAPAEKIIVTNQHDRPSLFFNGRQGRRISVEGLRRDVTALREGKITREQALKRLTVVNTETVEEPAADMEMLSSIFSRLYRPDLSDTYFAEGNVYYERLKDFGAIFYMRVVSSIEKNPNRFSMPTVGMDDLTQEARDQKVAELYPAFEEELKENILEYGRTVKSLGDEEKLIFNISLTKCAGCGIPATLELSLRGDVLKAFAAGKLDKSSAMKQFDIKRGSSQ